MNPISVELYPQGVPRNFLRQKFNRKKIQLMSRIISPLSKMWLKVVNLENSLFPKLQESLRVEEFSSKESKLIRVLDFSEIEQFITITSPTNAPKYREQIVRICSKECL